MASSPQCQYRWCCTKAWVWVWKGRTRRGPVQPEVERARWRSSGVSATPHCHKQAKHLPLQCSPTNPILIHQQTERHRHTQTHSHTQTHADRSYGESVETEPFTLSLFGGVTPSIWPWSCPSTSWDIWIRSGAQHLRVTASITLYSFSDYVKTSWE